MAVLATIRNLFAASVTPAAETEERVAPAPPGSYAVRPLTEKRSKEVLQLNMRCFRDGENYTKYTFAYLFSEPRALSYQAVTEDGAMAAYMFVLVQDDGVAHLTTIGVAPEHRRRGIAEMLLRHLEAVLKSKGVSTIVLEVRVKNVPAQMLYVRNGYATVKRIPKYYTDGEDCFMMVKSLL
jgi:[ribosomal protein S18]-alanine N-acetyltransferase